MAKREKEPGSGSRKTTVEPEKYEPPKLVKFDKLERLIVSGE
ncbi:MAG TPA: hypothetical protein VGW35_14145 [Methylomirabilota bacterium]|jgi:hypothetical protein|nr:hypothetical protein [Methylomirabilota bacterium]